MAVSVQVVHFGEDAARALREVIAEAQSLDPLAPVTVVVPRGALGLATRRWLASGTLGQRDDGHPGVLNVRFVTGAGELVLGRVMSDETVPPGEMVLTSGGDSIFPKGLPIGKVAKITPGSDLFLNIHVRPAADLSRLEEVLVVTKIAQAGGPAAPIFAVTLERERLVRIFRNSGECRSQDSDDRSGRQWNAGYWHIKHRHA